MHSHNFFSLVHVAGYITWTTLRIIPQGEKLKKCAYSEHIDYFTLQKFQVNFLRKIFTSHVNAIEKKKMTDNLKAIYIV